MERKITDMKLQKEIFAEMIFMAFMGAMGSFFFMCAIVGIDIHALGIGASLGFVSGFSGVYFSILLLWNYHRLLK